MTEFERLVKRKIELLYRSPEMLADASKKAQSRAWRMILEKVEDFDIKDGRIQQTNKNLALIEEISIIIKGSLTSLDYGKAMIEFVKDLDQSAQLSNRIAETINSNFIPTKFQQEFLEISKKNAVNNLFGETITGAATADVRDILTAAIASGNTFSETVKALKPVIIGDKVNDGKLLGRVRTYAGTTMSVVDGSYTAMIAEFIKADWYSWRGSEIKSTRPFCKARHDEYFHKKEIEAWGRGDDPTNIGGFKEDGTWSGEIEGTNQYTIFSLRGGWNCRHALIPVSISIVPDSVIQRAIAAGFYKKAA